MRMMVTLRVPSNSGSRAILDGSMPKVIEKVMGNTTPECAYFFLENGRRTMRAVFNLKEANDMVPAFEPAMMGFDAEVELTPVMTAEELMAGLAKMS